MSELRQRMIREMELRDFAENTQKAYLAAVEGLVRFYMKPPDQLNREQVELGFRLCRSILAQIRPVFRLKPAKTGAFSFSPPSKPVGKRRFV